MFQSGQFAHLFCLKELSPDWKGQLEEYAEVFLGIDRESQQHTPGYLHIWNVLYTVSEIFEFASRLVQSAVYEDSVVIDVSLRDIKDFVLAADIGVQLSNVYRTSAEEIRKSWTLTGESLVAASAKYSLQASAHIFERFGWDQALGSAMEAEQRKFLEGDL